MRSLVYESPLYLLHEGSLPVFVIIHYMTSGYALFCGQITSLLRNMNAVMFYVCSADCNFLKRSWLAWQGGMNAGNLLQICPSLKAKSEENSQESIYLSDERFMSRCFQKNSYNFFYGDYYDEMISWRNTWSVSHPSLPLCLHHTYAGIMLRHLMTSFSILINATHAPSLGFFLQETYVAISWGSDSFERTREHKSAREQWVKRLILHEWWVL